MGAREFSLAICWSNFTNKTRVNAANMFPMNFVNLSGQLGLMTMIVIGVPVEPSRCGSSCTPRTTGPSIIDVPWMPTEFPEGHGTLN